MIDAIRELHARSDPLETGGLLMGNVLADADGPYVLVNNLVLPLEGEILASPGTVHITAEGTANMTLRGREIDPLAIIVGWYHTHPRFRAYFSNVDLEEQRRWRKPLGCGLVFSGRPEGRPEWLVFLGPEATQTKGPTVAADGPIADRGGRIRTECPPSTEAPARARQVATVPAASPVQAVASSEPTGPEPTADQPAPAPALRPSGSTPPERQSGTLGSRTILSLSAVSLTLFAGVTFCAARIHELSGDLGQTRTSLASTAAVAAKSRNAAADRRREIVALRRDLGDLNRDVRRAKRRIADQTKQLQALAPTAPSTGSPPTG